MQGTCLAAYNISSGATLLNDGDVLHVREWLKCLKTFPEQNAPATSGCRAITVIGGGSVVVKLLRVGQGKVIFRELYCPACEDANVPVIAEFS